MIQEFSDRAARWRRRKQARPGEILDAALACFAERSFAATRLDDVAHRAGVTKGTLYLYFPNKAELFKAVVRQEVVPGIVRSEEMLGAADASSALLLEKLLFAWARLGATPAGAIPKIVVSEAGNFPDLARFYREEVVDRGLAVFRRVIEAGIRRGEFRAVEDLDSTVRCLVAPLLLALLWRHSLGRHGAAGFDPEALCRAQLRLALHGLACASAAAAPARESAA